MRVAFAFFLALATAPTCADEPKRSPEEQKLHEQLLVLNKNAQELLAEKKYLEAAKVFQKILEHLDSLKGDGTGNEIAFARLNTIFNAAACLNACGDLERSVTYFKRGVTLGRSLFSAEQFPKGHPMLALMLNQTGIVLQSIGRFAEALPYFEDALAMRRKQYPIDQFPDGHVELRAAIHNVGHVLSNIGQPDKAIGFNEELLALARRQFPTTAHPKGHEVVADALSQLAFSLVESGQAGRAESLFNECLAMRRGMYSEHTHPSGHESLGIAIQNVGFLHAAMGRPEQALRYYEEAANMFRRLYPEKEFPKGHVSLASALKGQGVVLKDFGEYDRALALFEQAYAMTLSAYPPSRFPKGHNALVDILNDLAFALAMVGRHDQAENYYRQALAMIEQLASNHPRLVKQASVVRSNFATLYMSIRKPIQALPLIEQSLAILRTLYPADRFPNGHPAFLIVLNNLNTVRLALGNAADGMAALDEAIGMARKLYPKDRFPQGHPELPTMLINRSVYDRRAGDLNKALDRLAEAADMQERRLVREADLLSESQILALRASLPPALHGYLDHAIDDSTHNARAFQFICVRQSQVLSVLRNRHQAARVAGLQSETVRAQWARLGEVRRESARLILDPAADAAARDRRLEELAQEQGNLERALASAMPGLGSLKTPDDFRKFSQVLPPGVAFVNFVRHGVAEYDAARTMRDTAFVVARGQPIRRVDLGPCPNIDQAVGKWRRAIETGNDREEASHFHKLVWSRVTSQLPPNTHTVYIYADTDLARVPWCAIPGKRDGSILLEEMSIAVVPSPAWLLEQLTSVVKEADEPSRMLLVGAVDYGGSGNYSPLSATGKEVDAAAELFPGRHAVRLTGAQATTKAVRSELSKAAFAHIATHGFFDDLGLAADRKRGEDALAQWQFRGLDRVAAGAGARNPLAYVGLALASANNPKADGVLTGLDLVDLPLEGLRLAVLSACETGLGALSFGEGVAGLQRAFHAAGCPNVIASLWNVNDAATAALMKKFYHELWVNNKPPLAALREAQLFIYYHPELIPDVLGERGAPKAKEALAVKSGEPGASATGVKKRADTKLWAGFVLSGVGK